MTTLSNADLGTSAVQRMLIARDLGLPTRN